MGGNRRTEKPTTFGRVLTNTSHVRSDVRYRVRTNDLIYRINREQPEVQLSWKLVPFSLQCACPKTILTPYWRHLGKFLSALLTFKRHFPVTKADVLYLYTKKPAVKTAGGTCQDGVLLMATMRCARLHARGHQLQTLNSGWSLFCDPSAAWGRRLGDWERNMNELRKKYATDVPKLFHVTKVILRVDSWACKTIFLLRNNVYGLWIIINTFTDR